MAITNQQDQIIKLLGAICEKLDRIASALTALGVNTVAYGPNVYPPRPIDGSGQPITMKYGPPSGGSGQRPGS
jgi:hypothetical protein